MNLYAGCHFDFFLIIILYSFICPLKTTPTLNYYVYNKNFLTLENHIFLGLIIIALLLDLRLGMCSDIAMLAIGGGSVLYDTSKIIKRYNKHKYVSASIELIASIVLVFWYSLRLFRGFEDRKVNNHFSIFAYKLF